MKDLLTFPNGTYRIDLDLCYLPFVEAMLNVLAKCRSRGQDYIPTFGYRSWAMQHQLRQKYLSGKGGKAAPAGLSAHNYGVAWDLAADGDMRTPNLQPNWNTKAYAILGEESVKAGLIWGGSFQDSPHVQWPGYVSSDQLRVLQNIWKQQGPSTDAQKLHAVWDFLDVTSKPMP